MKSNRDKNSFQNKYQARKKSIVKKTNLFKKNLMRHLLKKINNKKLAIGSINEIISLIVSLNI